MAEDDPFEQRRKLTFEQAEGAQPLPTQLKPKEISSELRSLLWVIFHQEIGYATTDFGRTIVAEPWLTIFRDIHVMHYHRMIDEYIEAHDKRMNLIKETLLSGNYTTIFGFLQAILRNRSCPTKFKKRVEVVLDYGRAAYFVLDDGTIAPKASTEEAVTIQKAFNDLRGANFVGARAHLQNAAGQLTAGQYADSVRESIHAVESLARLLEPSAELSKALAILESKAQIHGALRQAFIRLYGYTSDQQGIRHPLIEGSSPNVDEADALFMIGACAAFVSYLIAKGRAADLIK